MAGSFCDMRSKAYSSSMRSGGPATNTVLPPIAIARRKMGTGCAQLCWTKETAGRPAGAAPAGVEAASAEGAALAAPLRNHSAAATLPLPVSTPLKTPSAPLPESSRAFPLSKVATTSAPLAVLMAAALLACSTISLSFRARAEEGELIDQPGVRRALAELGNERPPAPPRFSPRVGLASIKPGALVSAASWPSTNSQKLLAFGQDPRDVVPAFDRAMRVRG